jgi:hypothetical protein
MARCFRVDVRNFVSHSGERTLRTEYTKVLIKCVFQVSEDFCLYPGLPTVINGFVYMQFLLVYIHKMSPTSAPRAPRYLREGL